MKYEKPEIRTVKIETTPIASSGLSDWLDTTDYAEAEGYITDYYMGQS